MKRPSPRARAEQLIQDLLPRLHRTAHYLSRDEHEAEDAVQETIARLLAALEKDAMRIRDPLAWCLTVAARIVSDGRRRAPAMAIEEEPAAPGDEPESALVAAERRAAVRRCVGELPAEEREAVCLHVFGELTIRETARAAGVSTSTAHARLHRGLDRLRRRLGPAVVAGVAPAALAPADLIAALRELPPPAVPESLAAGIAHLVSNSLHGSAAASLAGASLSTGGILMVKSKIVLFAASAALLAGTVGLGVRVGLSRGRAPEPAPGPQVSRNDPRLADLERENASLRERIAALEQGPGTERDEGEERKDAAGGRPAPLEYADRLLRAAIAAFESRDAESFRTAFLALLDAGSAAHPALIELLIVTGSYNQMLAVLDPQDPGFRVSFIHEVTARRESLGGLVDAILERASDPDRATLFAFDLVQVNRVRSGRPVTDHSASLLRVIERAIETEGDAVQWNDHVVGAGGLLEALRPKDALPRLEALVRSDGISERNQIALLRAVAAIGGEEAVAILGFARDRSPPALRTHLMSNLAMYDYGNPEIDAFLRETMDREEDPSSILRSLARREDAGELMVERLGDPGLGRSERLAILEVLLESGNGERREAAWKDLESAEPEIQDEVLSGLANTEPRAMELLLRRMESDAVSRELAGNIGRLDAKVVHAHREAFTSAAGNPALSSRTRCAAAAALAKVDPGTAARQVMVGFERSDEPARLDVVGTLRGRIGGEEAKALLGSIAAGDPSGKVRAAAAE
jgi:RNA polymerase sigma factor (sigma-70 family)